MLRFLRRFDPRSVNDRDGPRSSTQPSADAANQGSEQTGNREPANAHLPSDQVTDALESLRPLDYLLEPNIAQLQSVFDNADDKIACLRRFALFFVVRPEKLKLINTPYYHHHHAGNVVFDLILAAGEYGAGHLDLAESLIASHIEDFDDPFLGMLLARIQGAKGDFPGEAETVQKLRTRFPDDVMVTLFQLNVDLRDGNIAKANQNLDSVRPFVEELLKTESLEVQSSAADLADAIKNRRLSRSESFDIYDDALTRQTWAGYFEHFITQGRHQSGDGHLIDELDVQLTDFIGKHGIGTVLDFGSLCAEIIARPADKLRDTRFVGIDRQEFVATLNQEAYALPNMSFESGDIFDFLPQMKELPGPRLLFHVRTTCFLYPELVERIYAAAAQAGVDYIMGWEGDGLSRHHLRYFSFDDMPDISIARKGVLFNHNYRRILERAGYEITHQQNVTTLALCPDEKDLLGAALFFTARRRQAS
ncbi:hypothetical protein SAMN05877838_2117 [Hoeflea halophila]|uniref:Methyltransferase family protein n=1 Tax=Hoeflea halophila TaxID=714899 RepID=A0A286IAR0_9HYPH|nr:hypothetical protein [Hoeflea halophila]SOE17223.1 hypothetical protein SAMN05877838_2117 [Hoeflea halophila]